MFQNEYLNHDDIADNPLRSDVLCHHGILGMSWGHRNGPPYPLDKDDYSKAEKRAMRKAARAERSEARKAKRKIKHDIKNQKKAEKSEFKRKEVLRKGNAKQVSKLKGRISNDEYREVFQRLENERRLDELTSSQMKEISTKVNAAKNVLSNLKSGSDAAIGLYNNGADIYNTFLAGKNGRNGWKKVPRKEKKDKDKD